MHEPLYRALQVFGHASLRTRAFWTCFGILVMLAAVYGAVLALFLVRGEPHAATELLEPPGRAALVWRVALACWLFALPLIALVARMESRWIVRRVQQPIDDFVRQCAAIRGGRVAPRLSYGSSDAELAGLADAVNALMGHFDMIVLRQHRFAADAAHELRTPLTAQSVVGENALARHCTRAELREVVGSMLEESKHMKRLIETLLQLSRVAAVERAEISAARQPTPLELAGLARDCVESLQVLAEEKRQRIELAAGPVWADADPTLIRQALLNVIHNAIEHCPEGTRIQVATARFAADQAMIRVSDDGPGIPFDDQAHVFKRFYRVAGVTRRGSLGLGLSIAKAVLKSQRGNIHLRSEPGAGSCFTLTLPRCVSAEISSEPPRRDSIDGFSEELSRN